jgi:hypothetical protein
MVESFKSYEARFLNKYKDKDIIERKYKIDKAVELKKQRIRGGKTYICLVCSLELLRSDGAFCNKDEHFLCKECLKSYVVTGLEDGVAKSKCVMEPDCSGSYYDPDIGKVLTKEQKLQYDRKFFSSEIRQVPDFRDHYVV